MIEAIKVIFIVFIALVAMAVFIFGVFHITEGRHEKVCINGSVYLKKDGMLVDDGYAHHCKPLEQFKESE